MAGGWIPPLEVAKIRAQDEMQQYARALSPKPEAVLCSIKPSLEAGNKN